MCGITGEGVVEGRTDFDLALASNQPMGNENGSVWLVVNGETYNYQERRPETESRTARVYLAEYQLAGRDLEEGRSGVAGPPQRRADSGRRLHRPGRSCTACWCERSPPAAASAASTSQIGSDRRSGVPFARFQSE